MVAATVVAAVLTTEATTTFTTALATTLTSVVATVATTELATALATATGTTAWSTTSTPAAAAFLGLVIAVVNLDKLLSLALTLALGLATDTSNEGVLSVLLERLGVGPLLVDLGALVGLADLEVLAQSQFLLGLLGEVVGVGDALVLKLSGELGVLGILGNGVLDLGLGNLLASLLVLLLSFTLGSAP